MSEILVYTIQYGDNASWSDVYHVVIIRKRILSLFLSKPAGFGVAVVGSC